ncbi:glycosyl hydrolase [Coniella lustricola]|uniref:Arabinan endo-1,5-alpha-L-arabinosidase n=1 Tax=Coniella lustricola TaxID=2025994 RepID=A0A2T2ZW32_9PEZI|nr:glycosyl hydrolase [Coniella lustricola]
MLALRSSFNLLALLALACSLLPSPVSAAYADPGACSGECWTHDPAVVKRSDGTYFRFATGGGVYVYSAASLAGPWTYDGEALPSGSLISLSGNDDLWAPMVLLVGSTYYMYYAVSTFGTQSSAIGYATSTTLEVGSWTDHGSTGVASSSSKAYNAIDPSVYLAADGNYYMTFGSFWDDIYQVQMKNPPTAPAGSSSYNIAYNASTDHAEEASFVYLRGTTGYYYLFFSAGACCGYDTDKPAAGDEYSIRVCRSLSIAGPYVDENGVDCTESGGTTVLASHDYVYGPGGQGIFVDATYGGAVLYYHYADTNIGLADSEYQFGWNALSWSTGWPVPY